MITEQNLEEGRERVRHLLARQAFEEVTDLLAILHPSDLTDLLSGLEPDERKQAFGLLDDGLAGEVIAELDADLREELIESLNTRELADLVDEMPSDDAAELVDELPADVQEEVLDQLDEATSSDVRDVLEHEEDTAGRLMEVELVTVSESATVREAIEVIRRAVDEMDGQEIYNVYVVDDAGRLVGSLPLADLIITRSDRPVTEVMDRDVVSVPEGMDQEEVANIVRKYNLIILPVVDTERRLIGQITVDDVIDVIHEELTEDMLRLAGSDAEEMEHRSPTQIARMRLPWLFVTMGVELIAAVVISRFNQTLSKVIILASFMPIISAISGNVGVQAGAIIVRGLATGHVRVERWWWLLLRELKSGLLMALACGVTLGGIAVVWTDKWQFGAVVGTAMLCAMLTAGVLGTVIPLISEKVGFDPAVTAGPFASACQDVVGFAVFLGLATKLIHWLM